MEKNQTKKEASDIVYYNVEINIGVKRKGQGYDDSEKSRQAFVVEVLQDALYDVENEDFEFCQVGYLSIPEPEDIASFEQLRKDVEGEE